VSPSPLAPDHTRQHTLLATQTLNLSSGNHDMSRLSALAYLNDAPIQSLTDKPLAYFQRVLGVATSILALPLPRHGNTH
jgi:hypothetical protein